MICPNCKKPFNLTRKTPAATIKKIHKLREDGYSLREIAAKVGVSFSVVGRLVKDEYRPTEPA